MGNLPLHAMKILGSLLLLLMALAVGAQLPTGNSGEARSFMNQFVIADQAAKTSKPALAYQGTPYLLDEWNSCDITGIKGQIFEDVRIKYNVFNKYLLHQPLRSKDSVLIRDDLIKTFTIKSADSNYHFQRFLLPIESQTDRMNDFFIVLDSGRYLLLVQPIKRLQETTSNALTRASTDQIRRYVDDVVFYIRTPDRTVLPARGSKKHRATLFGEDFQEVLQFAKIHRLSWRDRASLERIIQYANSLQKKEAAQDR